MWREADEWFLAEFSVYCSVTREFGRFFYLSSRGSGNPEPPKCFLPSSDSCMICVFFLVFGVFVIWFSERTFYHRKLQPHCFFGNMVYYIFPTIKKQRPSSKTDHWQWNISLTERWHSTIEFTTKHIIMKTIIMVTWIGYQLDFMNYDYIHFLHYNTRLPKPSNSGPKDKGKERRKTKNQRFEAVYNRRVLGDLQPAAGKKRRKEREENQKSEIWGST